MNLKLLFFPLTLIILVSSVIGVTKPTWDEYKTQKEEVIKLGQEKKELEVGVANIKKALASYRNLDEDTKSYVNNAIPVDSDDDNLIAELNKNISQSGILAMKIDTNKKKAMVSPKCRQAGAEKNGLNCAAKASMTKVTLSAAGTYPMIKDFLSKLDVQNRIIVPGSISLSAPNNSKENEDSSIRLITAKISFDVFQKKPVKVESFSKIMASDIVLKSLLQKGLSAEGLEAVSKFITSDVFMPVQVEGVGKSDLFQKNGEVKAQEIEVDNKPTI